MRVPGHVAICLGRGGRDGRAVARGEAARVGGIVLVVRLVAELHGDAAVIGTTGERVGAGSLGTTVRSVEVIYWG